ncbi:YjzC family protein [Oceanidesulfovibrio marinus]|uniref:YjzC family protein n=1 Tax=Oceanidesulfovibrio marinus TaxID=370038 RepID=A0A6P1ZH17_9BACT|nr:YjzC family protein [Oceanidesulfovibrio marinus]QJT10373.1 YjzC family protein [Oceanidesulfovibrio marinus]TVM32321.1 YjzC family protein [Oceanidesulfovibrio marinus]
MSEKKITVKPGEIVPDSGIYMDDSGRKATMVKGEHAPPTSKPGEQWTQVVSTHSQS